MKHRWRLLLGLLLLAAPCRALATARDYLNKPSEWFHSPEATQIITHILSYQSERGGWPKNIDTTARPYSGTNPAKDLAPTFDNRATTDELRLLARAFHATHEERCKAAFLKGYDYILAAQYPNGGWPQASPARSYQLHITFNDDAMVRLLEFLRESYTSDQYDLLDPQRRQKAKAAFAKGIDCILRCQVRVNGELTAWCAQHDERTLQPAPARAFELVSLSGSESVGILRLLMSLDNPSPAVIDAVNSAAAWLEHVKLTGVREIAVEDPSSPTGHDKRLIHDDTAPPLWARFYEINTNRPFFCDRDGIKKYQLSEIGPERRNGYAWLGAWPAHLLSTDYPGWKRKFSEPHTP